MFSSSTLIRLNKDAFEGHLCQTVNNFVKQNKLSLLSPLRKRRPPQYIKHIRNTTFDEPCSSTLHPLNFITVVFLVWVPNSGAIKERIKEKLAVCLSFSGQPSRLRRKNESLELALFVMVAMCFDHSRSLLRVTSQVLSVHDFLQYLSCQ